MENIHHEIASHVCAANLVGFLAYRFPRRRRRMEVLLRGAGALHSDGSIWALLTSPEDRSKKGQNIFTDYILEGRTGTGAGVGSPIRRFMERPAGFRRDDQHSTLFPSSARSERFDVLARIAYPRQFDISLGL